MYYPVTFANNSYSAPDAPTSGTYNFSTNAIASLASGWQLTQPAIATGVLYWTSEALATESSTANVSNSLTWSTPSNSLTPQNDTDFIFQRSASQPSTPGQTNWPAIPSGWNTDIGDVPAGSNPIWVSKGVAAFSTSGGFTYKYTWEAPVRIEGADGTDGGDGTNNATLTLYKRSTSGSSAPAVPNGNVTYTFSSSSVTNTADLDGWTLNGVPSGTAQYLWSCSAVASSNTATDVIATGEWSTPQVQSEAQQPRTQHKPVFYDAWTLGSSLPSAPTATNYDFDAKTFTGLTSGWSASAGTVPFAICVLEIKEATFGATPTFTPGPVTPVGGKYDRFDPDNIVIDVDDTNNKIRFRPDSSLDYKEATISNKYRNDQIAISKNNGQIRLTNTGANTDVAIAKGDVGLGAVDNVQQFSESNIPAKINNEQLNLFADGTSLKLKFGSTTISNGDTGALGQGLVGLSGVSNNANKTSFSGNALLINDVSQGNVKNSGISIAANGALAGAGGGTVKANAIGAVQTSLANAPDGIKNASLNLFQDGTQLKIKFGNTTITNGSTGALTQSLVGLSGVANNADRTADNTAAAIAGQGDLATRSDVRAGTHIKDSSGAVLGNDDIKNSSLDVDISGTSMRLKIGSTVTSTVTATQGLVGLSGVSNNANKTSFSGNALLIDNVSQGNVKNSGITLAANGVLSGGGTSSQVNIGSIASTPFDTSGNVDTGETITVGSKITIDRDNERILIED